MLLALALKLSGLESKVDSSLFIHSFFRILIPVFRKRT